MSRRADRLIRSAFRVFAGTSAELAQNSAAQHVRASPVIPRGRCCFQVASVSPEMVFSRHPFTKAQGPDPVIASLAKVRHGVHLIQARVGGSKARSSPPRGVGCKQTRGRGIGSFFWKREGWHLSHGRRKASVVQRHLPCTADLAVGVVQADRKKIDKSSKIFYRPFAG
jgi:hypothetical protein